MSRPEFIKNFVLALASALLLYLSGVAIPLVGVLLLPLVPQPALAFGVKYGKAGVSGLLGLGTLILLILAGQGLALGFSILALMVVLLCWCLGRGWSIEWVVVGPACGMLGAVSVFLLSLSGSFGDLQGAIRGALKENLEISLKVYEQIGFSQESMEALRQRTPQMIEVVLQTLPALAFFGFVVVILINLYFLHRRFPERELFVPAGDLREWKSPEPLVWCFIISGFALFLPGWLAFRALALNLFLVIAVFYFFQGLAIVAYYLHHKNVPVLLRSVAYALIVFEQFLTLFVVGLGLFDLWGDFRRLKKKDLNPSQAA